jgi:hypothetical protein
MLYRPPSTGVPEPPRLCELRNDSNLEVVCQPGNDGGLQQHFVLEAVGATSMYFNNLDSTRSTHELLDNEISTMNDQVRFALGCGGQRGRGVGVLLSFCRLQTAVKVGETPRTVNC